MTQRSVRVCYHGDAAFGFRGHFGMYQMYLILNHLNTNKPFIIIQVSTATVAQRSVRVRHHSDAAVGSRRHCGMHQIISYFKPFEYK